jgi:hypothetical protein
MVAAPGLGYLCCDHAGFSARRGPVGSPKLAKIRAFLGRKVYFFPQISPGERQSAGGRNPDLSLGFLKKETL